ncbi:cadherin repeat domain-containing protein [Aquimarina sp. 2304DJ70-9]|uniref:cadherin repeat domain-containing protein n=1 Tax=Aquimarina penaris TaxID=3231044 RepID=UPI0034625683
MKKIGYFILIIFFSCSSDDGNNINSLMSINVSTEDFTISINENPSENQVLGTVKGVTNQGTITFSIVSQSPNNSFSINQSTGELTVLNTENYDFENNSSIIGEVKVANGEIFKTSTITINLNDIDETVFAGDIILSSQQEINDFGAKQYTQVTGLLRVADIEGGDIDLDITSLAPLGTIKTVGSLRVAAGLLQDLSGLENITTVTNDLTIVFCDLITDLDELSNITSVNGDLRIFGNDSLTNMDGLSNITSVGQWLRISNNPLITSISIFNNLTTVGKMEIESNDSLINLDGLENIQTVNGDLEIIQNILIKDLNALSNIREVSGDLIIERNFSLLNLDGLRNITSVGEYVGISLNPLIKNLNGLGKLTSIGGSLIISNNSSLESLDGIAPNTSLGLSIVPALNGDVDISWNDSLISIDALSNIISEGSISIHQNESLINVNGLNNKATCHDLSITYNITLTDLCGISNLVQNNNIKGMYNVEENANNPTQQDIIDGNCQI